MGDIQTIGWLLEVDVCVSQWPTCYHVSAYPYGKHRTSRGKLLKQHSLRHVWVQISNVQGSHGITWACWMIHFVFLEWFSHCKTLWIKICRSSYWSSKWPSMMSSLFSRQLIYALRNTKTSVPMSNFLYIFTFSIFLLFLSIYIFNFFFLFLRLNRVLCDFGSHNTWGWSYKIWTEKDEQTKNLYLYGTFDIPTHDVS